MASLAASARLHRRPAPHSPGGAPQPSSRRPRPSRRLPRPPPWSRRGNSNGSERSGEGRARCGAAQLQRGAAGRGPASGAALGRPAGLPGAGRDTGPWRDWKSSPRAGAGLQAGNESRTPFLLPVGKRGSQGRPPCAAADGKPFPEPSLCAFGPQGTQGQGRTAAASWDKKWPSLRHCPL